MKVKEEIFEKVLNHVGNQTITDFSEVMHGHDFKILWAIFATLNEEGYKRLDGMSINDYLDTIKDSSAYEFMVDLVNRRVDSLFERYIESSIDLLGEDYINGWLW